MYRRRIWHAAVRTASTAILHCRGITNGWNSRQLGKFRQMLVSYTGLTTSYEKCILSGNIASRLIPSFTPCRRESVSAFEVTRHGCPSYSWDTTIHVRSSCSSGRHERVVNWKRKRNEAVAISAFLEMNTSIDTSDIYVSMNLVMTLFVRCNRL